MRLRIMNKKYQAVVFDMDGVLIDSKNCMRMCWNAVQENLQIVNSFDDYFIKIGKPFRKILSELSIAENMHNDAERIYFDAQRKYVSLIKPFPGIEKALSELSVEYLLGLVTSKNSKSVSLILEKFGWRFSHVITPENCFRGKPHPDPLLYYTAFEQLNPSECLYIGDMLVDMSAAQAAGYDFIRAGWGYQYFEANTADTPEDLMKMIGVIK